MGFKQLQLMTFKTHGGAGILSPGTVTGTITFDSMSFLHPNSSTSNSGVDRDRVTTYIHISESGLS